jgi:glycogen debranching enzyme
MLSNRRSGPGFSFTVPSPSSYPYQWLWDSCFHAVILSYFDPVQAQTELRTLVSRQFQNGMLPHMIYWQKAETGHFPDIRWGKRGTSSLTQPPLLAHAVWQVYTKTQDNVFLEELYPALRRFDRYWLRHRDPRKNHLIGLINPDESGEDNSPRFDRALKLPANHDFGRNFQRRLQLVDAYRDMRFVVKDRMDTMHWVRDVPVNAMLARAFELEAAMAEVLNRPDEADRAARHAQLIKNAMRQYLLGRHGQMWSTTGRDYRPVRIKTWALFSPLLAGVLTPEEADQLLERHWSDPEGFGSPFRLPTVALGERSFDPGQIRPDSLPYHLNWRGPVWFASNWLIYHGLKRYERHEEADRLRYDSLRLLKRSGFREYYNPLTGRGLGARDFTWGGLVIDMN